MKKKPQKNLLSRKSSDKACHLVTHSLQMIKIISSLSTHIITSWKNLAKACWCVLENVSCFPAHHWCS